MGRPTGWCLADHGDALEIAFWPLFGKQFPAYETYWRKYTVPLTRRDAAPYDHGFKSDRELAILNPPRTKVDLLVAKLHYATFWHLSAVHRLRHSDLLLDLDSFTHCIIRLASARDTTAAFAGMATGLGKTPKAARHAWFKANPNPRMLQLGNYRNHLVHGAPFMQLDVGGLSPLYPRIGLEDRYHDDWRGGFRKSDFARPEGIVDSAWPGCLRYAERSWRAVLKAAGPPSTYPLPTPEVGYMVRLRKGLGRVVTSSSRQASDPFVSEPISGASRTATRRRGR